MLLAGWRRLDIATLYKFCERTMLGFGGLGWPDLTLFKGQQMKFVEIKQAKDRFTHRQAYWVRNIAKPLNLDLVVLHVVNGDRPRKAGNE
jgi:hypothetical protein